MLIKFNSAQCADKKIITYFGGVNLCGQISDPILNPHFIDFLKICKKENKPVTINTAVSQKPEKWYREAFKVNKDAKWTFGIDGLPYQSFCYRINQDGEKLFKMMVIAKELGLRKIIWQYIVFKYNENYIEQATELANKHNILLELNYSGRWNLWDDPYEPKNPEYKIKRKKNINEIK